MALNHVKPHGSLYGMAARDPSPRTPPRSPTPPTCSASRLMGWPAPCTSRSGARRGVAFVAEFYVDLDYRDDGSAAHHPPAEATEPASRRRAGPARAHRGRRDLADTGEELPVRADSVCVHSDTPNAVELAARRARRAQAHHRTH